MKTLGTSQTYTNDPIKGTFTTTVDMNQVSEIFENHNIINDLDFDKKETLEEVAERYKNLKLPDDLYDGFIAGAQWQAEQDKNKYSEEQVLKLVDGAFHMYASSKRHDAKEWLVEQFKKK